MGSNRAGDRAKAREKRRRREERRLSCKAAEVSEPKKEAPGIVAIVKDVAVAAAQKVGDIVTSAAVTVKDVVKKKDPEGKKGDKPAT